MENRNQKIGYWVGAIVVLVGLGFGARYLMQGEDKEQKVPLAHGDLVETAYAVGSVKAERTFNLKTGVSSRVNERYVRIGDKVKKGDKLVQLEGLPLYRSPFDGVVTTLAYEDGELVFANTVVMTVVDYNSFYLELNMDERTIASIKKDQEVRISFEGLRDKPRTGKVRAVYASNGDFLVAVDADFKDMSLQPGMTCDVAVKIAEHKGKLLVPLGAVAPEGFVTVVQNGKKVDVTIVRGATDGQYAVISSGDVKDGDMVLIRSIKSNKPAPRGI